MCLRSGPASWDLESHQETWQQSRVHAACPKAPAFRPRNKDRNPESHQETRQQPAEPRGAPQCACVQVRHPGTSSPTRRRGSNHGSTRRAPKHPRSGPALKQRPESWDPESHQETRQQPAGLCDAPQSARVQVRPRNKHRNPGTLSSTRRCGSNPWGYAARPNVPVFRSGPETKTGILGPRVPPGDVAAIHGASRRAPKRPRSGPASKQRPESWDPESHQETRQQPAGLCSSPQSARFQVQPRNKDQNPGTSSPTRRCGSNPRG
ncbi:hypothetical protein NDU88_003002 [Pleurodeles waltl]|uniref:Uncharacterized protein n=1 Tax=Pleurodeles waltl TaxID=8319 RepID=A0AAV7VGP5_PLEWA|nr:hypothetical protein NDU88_003002 [Pleurodeles waltl]